MAGTLLLLKQAGWEIHCFNLSTGNCGSVRYRASETRRLRLAEAKRTLVVRNLFVKTAGLQKPKLAALAEHRTQQEWLDVSQGMNSYLRSMEQTSRAIGHMSGRFAHAEGWRRHSHLGFCAAAADPL